MCLINQNDLTCKYKKINRIIVKNMNNDRTYCVSVPKHGLNTSIQMKWAGRNYRPSFPQIHFFLLLFAARATRCDRAGMTDR